MRSAIVLTVIGVAALLGAALAGQQTQPFPGPGTGIVPVKVQGPVDVSAAQIGEWKVLIDKTADVRVANTPPVHIAVPDFVKAGTSYTVSWATGKQEKVEVKQVGATGSIRTVREGRPRSINLAAARAVEEAR